MDDWLEEDAERENGELTLIDLETFLYARHGQ